MNNKLKFHQKVNTPNGPGIVQGWLVMRDETGNYVDGKVLVSHAKRPDEYGVIRGVWELEAYKLEEISDVQ